MKKRIFPFILGVIAVMSSCGETANSTAKETTTTTTVANTNEAESEQPTETTVTETTTTSETTTTAPVIEPIIEHEKLPMQEAFIKVVENDAQEKVKEITEYNKDDEVYKVAVTESGTEYVLIFRNNYIYEILYDDNALIDINFLKASDIDWGDFNKEVFHNENYYISPDSSEELTISEILSRTTGTDLSVESIECDEIMNTCMLTCNHGIKISCRGLLYPDIDHKYHIDENDSLPIESSFHSEYWDAEILAYPCYISDLSELHEDKGNTAITGRINN